MRSRFKKVWQSDEASRSVRFFMEEAADLKVGRVQERSESKD